MKRNNARKSTLSTIRYNEIHGTTWPSSLPHSKRQARLKEDGQET